MPDFAVDCILLGFALWYLHAVVQLTLIAFMTQVEEILLTATMWHATVNLCKGKVDHAAQESVGGCSSLSVPGLEPVGGEPPMSDVWPVRRQIYGKLPSCQRHSPPIDWYQIILLVDRGTYRRLSLQLW